MKKSGRIRIIGGRWRHRIIQFPQIDNLRPSPDAVRETLFNWLAPYISDSICLDLFAGSGAFGFEAVSRGARKTVLVESNAHIIHQLQRTSHILDADDHIDIRHGLARDYIKNTDEKFDLVFIDPPFQLTLIQQTCKALVQRHCLKHQALVYIESPKSNIPLPIPETWHIIRQVQRGLVQSTLINT